MRACRGLFVSDANRRDASHRGFSVFGRGSLYAKKNRFASGFERSRADLRLSSLWAPEMRQLKARSLSCSDHRSGRSIRLSSGRPSSKRRMLSRMIGAAVAGLVKAATCGVTRMRG